MSLSADLRALGEVLAPPEAQWGDPELPTALLDPRLRTTYSPRLSWMAHRSTEEVQRAPSMPEWARVWEPGPPAQALGLSLAPNSERPPRYGLQGMPSPGRRNVWRALALLEEQRACLSFWTVSLPTEALRQLAEGDSLPTFQDRLRRELSRLLRRAGLPDLVVGVVELQPKRTRQTGIPCPHWHIVFQGRKDRRAPWALGKEALDGVIASALGTAGVRVEDLRAAGNVQKVRKSVRAYLSKYMTKGGNDVAPHVGGQWEGLIPRQWWFWTRTMRAWVLEHVLPIAFDFLAWVHAMREAIEGRALAQFRLIPLSDPRAPQTWEVSWQSCEHLAQLVQAWQVDAWDAQWERSVRLSRWQP